MSAFLNWAAGAVTGVLSSFGIGGGTLLLLYLTFFAGFSQQDAQGVNLLYFLPTAGASLPGHLKNGLIDKQSALWGGACGCAAAVAGSLAAATAAPSFLRKCFGGYLVVTGLLTFFRKKRGAARLS